VRQTAWDRQGDAPTRPRPQITVEIADSAGNVIRTLTANAAEGIHTISWDLRAERPKPELSPSRKIESKRLAERAIAVRDSLVEADWDAAMVGRLTGLFTGETNPMDLFRAFQGGGPRGDPERFRPRPGESTGGGGFGGFSEMSTIAGLVNPGEGLRGLFRLFEGGGGEGPLVEPGTYTVTATAEDHAFEPVTVEVGRVGDYQGRTAPFETEVRRRFP